MNPQTLKEVVFLAKASDRKGIIIAAPFIFLEKICSLVKRAKLSAQDLFYEERGAFTGEISAGQLKNIGVDYVIVGHSERRKLGETDDIIAGKMEAAVKSKLTPILCIGETTAEKEKGLKEEVLSRQIRAVLSRLKNQRIKNLFIAYEPTWAIGTGNPEAPESALTTILYIKSLVMNAYNLLPIVFYGGSVDSKNIENYIKYKEIDGALVGGASLKKDEIKKMISLLK